MLGCFDYTTFFSRAAELPMSVIVQRPPVRHAEVVFAHSWRRIVHPLSSAIGRFLVRLLPRFEQRLDELPECGDAQHCDEPRQQ